MKTTKTLQQLVLNLTAHIKDHWDSHVEYNTKLIDITNGNLLKYVKESLKIELSEKSYDRSKTRIPPLNVLKKLQLKLNKVYAESPGRALPKGNTTDIELLDAYVEAWGLDDQLTRANELLVINKYCALEPYQHDGEAHLRVLSAKEFLVFSDSLVNPNEMTVFIKFMGTIKKEDSEEEVPLFNAYSEEEFMVFDLEGDVISLAENPYKKIPFVYMRTKRDELIPTPEQGHLAISLIVSKLFTDLNYNVMFGCRSQIVGIDVAVGNNQLEYAPDNVWLLQSVQNENNNAKPSIDTIKADVDVDKVLALCNAQLGMWLETEGIKTGAIGQASVEKAASGISKLIDESDATSVNRTFKKTFLRAEKALWKLLPILHTHWLSSNETEQTKAFSADFKPAITLVDAKVMPDTKAILEEQKLKKDLELFTKERALKELYPDADDEAIKVLLDELVEQLIVDDYADPADPIEVVVPALDDGSENLDSKSIMSTVDPASLLNGAQVTALLKIIEGITLGVLTKESAKGIIQQAFGMNDEQSGSIINSIEEGSAKVGSKE